MTDYKNSHKPQKVKQPKNVTPMRGKKMRRGF